MPPYSNRVLATLSSECVKATYFIVGSMARAYPDVLRKIYAAGHTIGTHSQHHPMNFNSMPLTRAEAEIEDGIATTAAALGDRKALSPFFRIPGFARSSAVEGYVEGRGLMLWSADFPADDWKHISAAEIVRRALSRIEAKGRGILLLHDIHGTTADALPVLLRELKARGYHIVHVVPATAEQPKTATAPQDWQLGRTAHALSRMAKAPVRHAHKSHALTPAGSTRSETEPQIIDLPRQALNLWQPVSQPRSKRKIRLMMPIQPATPLVLSN